MIRLLDINVLLAIAWPQHVHHARVKRWIIKETAQGKLAIATCPITQLGFSRISMNVRGYAADFESALLLLAGLVSHKNFDHSFWKDDFSILSGRLKHTLGPNQLTDAYLAALAKNRPGGKLLTLDAGIKGSNIEMIPD